MKENEYIVITDNMEDETLANLRERTDIKIYFRNSATDEIVDIDSKEVEYFQENDGEFVVSEEHAETVDKIKTITVNINILAENNIRYVSIPWENSIYSGELETYTDAGENMIIDLEEITKEKLEEYIENFDSNEEVLMWWENGIDKAHEKGVPFNNIKDHYDDYEAYLKNLRSVAQQLL